MTEKQLRQKVVNWLENLNGSKDYSAGHKKILDVFNKSGLCSRYKMTVNDPWCATGTSAAFIATGLTEIFPCVECSCSAMIALAKQAGIWVENDAYKPKIADVVLYDWDDDGVGDNKGDPDHVGIVAGVSGSYIDVIEGNMGEGKVGHRKIAINGRYIRGYICPKFASLATKSTGTTNNTTSAKKASTSSTNGKAGTKVSLKNAPLYASSTAKLIVNRLTGDYYLWDGEKVNGRYRITNSKANAGKSNAVTGWIDAKYVTGSTAKAIKVGGKVKVKKAVTYDGEPFTVYKDKYDVIEVSGDRVVIGIGKTVTAAVKASNLTAV